MKNRKIFTANWIALLVLLATYGLTKLILEAENIALTKFSINTFINIGIVLLAFFLIQIIVFSYKSIKKRETNSKRPLMSWLSISLASLSLLALLVYGSLGLFSSYKKEHTIEKDGKLMVASVDSFMEVNVNYYDYINKFIRGSKVKIFENYGDGSYDPFELDKMPELKMYTYYDEKGKVIKSNISD